MTDIAELFRRDPLDLTDDDIEKIVEHYRKARAAFNLTSKPTRKTKPKVEVDPNAASVLKDLGL